MIITLSLKKDMTILVSLRRDDHHCVPCVPEEGWLLLCPLCRCDHHYAPYEDIILTTPLIKASLRPLSRLGLDIMPTSVIILMPTSVIILMHSVISLMPTSVIILLPSAISLSLNCSIIIRSLFLIKLSLSLSLSLSPSIVASSLCPSIVGLRACLQSLVCVGEDARVWVGSGAEERRCGVRL